MTEAIIFYAFSAVILLSAFLMVTSKNIFHSALYLALTLFGVAGIYVLLNAYFIAGIQVLIYIGAIVVLTIFVINLTREILGEPVPLVNKQILPALLTAGLAGTLIILALMKTKYLAVTAPMNQAANDTATIGKLLLGDYMPAFELASVLLLAALIGAIVIVAKDREEAK
jgi:NADH:ubiquinone oxidoreductase subunit 6 (subunit J)